MPIGFARMQILSLGAGHSVVQRYDYIGRRGAFAARQDLAFGPVTLAPQGTPSHLKGRALWQELEAKAPRKDAVVGAELVLALPLFSQLSLSDAQDLVIQFCRAMIVSHDLAASFAIHGIHDDLGADEDAAISGENPDGPSVADLIDTVSSWPHAHVLLTPRALGPSGLSPRRCNLLEPVTRGTGDKRTVICAVPWGEIWTRYLNGALQRCESTARVRLKAPHGGQHLGPARAMALLQGDIASGVVPEGRMWPRVNSQIEARNGLTLREAPKISELVVTRAAVADLLSRYLDIAGKPLSRMTDRLLNQIDAVPLIHPLTGAPTCWLTSRATLDRARRVNGLAKTMSDARLTPRDPDVSLARLTTYLHHDPELASPLGDLLVPGHRLVTIEDGDLGSNLLALDEILRHARQEPTHIGHKAMTIAPFGRKRVNVTIPSQLHKRLAAQSLVIIDRPDALALPDLETLLELAISRDCQILFVRRPNSLVFPRSVVVDRIAGHGRVHRLAASLDPVLTDRLAPVDRELSRLSASPPQTAAGAFEDYRSPPPAIHRPDPSRSTKLIGDDRQPTGSVVVPQSDFVPERSNLAADGEAARIPGVDTSGPPRPLAPPSSHRNRLRPTPTLVHAVMDIALRCEDERVFFAAAAFGDQHADGADAKPGLDIAVQLAELYSPYLVELVGIQPGVSKGFALEALRAWLSLPGPDHAGFGRKGEEYVGIRDSAALEPDHFNVSADDDPNPEETLDYELDHDDPSPDLEREWADDFDDDPGPDDEPEIDYDMDVEG